MSQALTRAEMPEFEPRDPVDQRARPGIDRPLRMLMPSYRSNPTTGGQGVYMRLITKALADRGHEIDVISGQPYPVLDPRCRLIKMPSLDLYADPHPIKALWSGKIRDGLDVKEWWLHNSGGFPEPYTFGERMARWARTRVNDYDIVHDNQTLCWGLLKMRDMGMPVLGTIHHPITRDRRIDIKHAPNPFYAFLKWRWYSFLNMQIKVARELEDLIVVSKSTLHDVSKDFGLDPNRLQLCYHGIDTEQWRPMPEIERKPNRLIACASADVPLKGLIYLIRAYDQLLPKYPDLELVVIGSLREGNTSRELERRGIKDKVKFISGGLTDEDITRMYAEATIAISPSVYEGFGFPCGEAMACGAPVISTDGGSLPEVAGDAAMVVPNSNPEALAKAISSLLDDKDLRDRVGAAGRDRILREFQWSRTAENLEKIYLETINSAHGRLRQA